MLYADDKVKSTHAYFVQNYFLTCEDCYNEAADYIAKVLTDHEMPSAVNVSGLSDSFRLSSHLSKINLSTFDGSFDKWESFHNRFTSMLRSDTSLSNLERMHYLCSYVKEDASNALNYLAVTNNNFDVAWKILVFRYNNKRRLIIVHLQSLMNLLSLTSKISKDLRKLRDQTNNAIQALRNHSSLNVSDVLSNIGMICWFFL